MPIDAKICKNGEEDFVNADNLSQTLSLSILFLCFCFNTQELQVKYNKLYDKKVPYLPQVLG